MKIGIRKMLRNYGVSRVSFYVVHGTLHIFYEKPGIDEAVAGYLNQPVFINGVAYNRQKRPP